MMIMLADRQRWHRKVVELIGQRFEIEMLDQIDRRWRLDETRIVDTRGEQSCAQSRVALDGDQIDGVQVGHAVDLGLQASYEARLDKMPALEHAACAHNRKTIRVR